MISEIIPYGKNGSYFRYNNRIVVRLDDEGKLPAGINVVESTKKPEPNMFHTVFGDRLDGISYEVVGWAKEQSDE
jgi:hypothetical protein